MSEEVDDFLAHYGVKGMRWGKRQSSATSDVPSKSDRKAAKEAFKPVWEMHVDRAFSDSSITQTKYSSLSTKDVSIKKGTELARITKRKDEKLRDITYLSYTAKDRERYKAIMSGDGAAGKKKYKDNYEHVFKATTTLKSPSEKARLDAYIELMDTSSIVLKNGKTISGREHLKRIGYRKEAKTLTSQELGLKHYNDMVNSQYMTTPVNTAYFNNIRAKGYNAIIDDNDRLHLTDSPVIILDPDTSKLKRTSVRQLSNQEITDAQKAFKLPD